MGHGPRVDLPSQAGYDAKVHWTIAEPRICAPMAPAYPDISPTVFYVSHGDGVRTIQSGPQDRQLRQTVTGPYAAERAKGKGLSFFSEDSRNLMRDTQGFDSED